MSRRRRESTTKTLKSKILLTTKLIKCLHRHNDEHFFLDEHYSRFCYISFARGKNGWFILCGRCKLLMSVGALRTSWRKLLH